MFVCSHHNAYILFVWRLSLLFVESASYREVWPLAKVEGEMVGMGKLRRGDYYTLLYYISAGMCMYGMLLVFMDGHCL